MFSMTGYGRGEASSEDYKITVEIKSVNHRFLEISARLPKVLSSFESKIRDVVREFVSRGKVDLYITYESYRAEDISLSYNEALAGEYLKILNKMKDDFHLDQDLTVSKLASFPEVLMQKEKKVDETAIWPVLDEALRVACKEFVESRKMEGDRLLSDLLSKMEEISGHVSFISSRSPILVEEFRQKLSDRISDLLKESGVDESRIAMETTIYADKIAVDEELVRLSSHVQAMKDTMESSGELGRKLDFLAQEMNRESNTILSKSGDVEICDHAIELKTLIEKVREQVQNIE